MNEAAESATDEVTDIAQQSQDCVICAHHTDRPLPAEIGRARGNTTRFMDTTYTLWKCPQCESIHCLNRVDIADIYSDYPLNAGRKLDAFARGTLSNLLGRLTDAGLEKHHSVLDFGSGNGVFIQFMQQKGYSDIEGYDPYIAEFSELPTGHEEGYDCVVANDVLEHCEDPCAMVEECLNLVKPGGILYVGTADSEGVLDMGDLEPHLMRLHLPFHRVIVTHASLLKMGSDLALEQIATWKRSYMDTRMPFANYRFLDEFNAALGHRIDLALDPKSGSIVMKKPKLFFYGFFGSFIPSADEPAVIWRKPA